MVEVVPGHEAQVGAFTVRRVLPRAKRRTIGAWCFADHMGPTVVDERQGLDVGPHPHTGLQTVTWLTSGAVLHRDSLGSEQVIMPGQLNLMSAGRGVSHSEERTGGYRGTLEGIQLWIAQPDSTRDGPAAFTHHAELPQVDLDGATATVLVGSFGGERSAAAVATPLVGLDLGLRGRTTLPIEPGFEHGMVVLSGAVLVDGEVIVPGALAYLGAERDELQLEPTGDEPARVILLGGEPLATPPLMWWNFVARTRDEIDAAYTSWHDDDGRFGTVASALPRIPVAPPLWHSR